MSLMEMMTQMMMTRAVGKMQGRKYYLVQELIYKNIIPLPLVNKFKSQSSSNSLGLK
jgi:hypothetical protein